MMRGEDVCLAPLESNAITAVSNVNVSGDNNNEGVGPAPQESKPSTCVNLLLKRS